jgi:hypothetical protein
MEIDQLIDSENLIADYDFILSNVNDILYNLLTGEDIHRITNNDNRGYVRINIKVTPKKKKKKLMKELLSHLPKYQKIKEEDDLITQQSCCAICTNKYKKGEYKRVLPCGHCYHKKCIDKWFMCNKKMSCALCRTCFVKKMDEQNIIINEETQSRIFRNEIQSI